VTTGAPGSFGDPDDDVTELALGGSILDDHTVDLDQTMFAPIDIARAESPDGSGAAQSSEAEPDGSAEPSMWEPRARNSSATGAVGADKAATAVDDDHLASASPQAPKGPSEDRTVDGFFDSSDRWVDAPRSPVDPLMIACVVLATTAVLLLVGLLTGVL